VQTFSPTHPVKNALQDEGGSYRPQSFSLRAFDNQEANKTELDRGVSSFDTHNHTARFVLASETANSPAPVAHPRVVQEWHGLVSAVLHEVNGRIHVSRKEAKIHLEPPELGKLEIEISIDGNKLAARISTETQESSNFIEAHLIELRQALQDNHFELVDVRVDNGGFLGHGGPHQENYRGPSIGLVATDGDESTEPQPIQLPAAQIVVGRVSMWA
jgi:flagellar hook-length control protein FliK